jgi:DNA repair protein RadC
VSRALNSDSTRRKILDGAVADLTDSEVLTAVLRPSLRGARGALVASDLLVRFGGLEDVLRQSASELSAVPGMGPARIARLQASVELGRRYLEAPARRLQVLKSPQDAASCFRARLADLPHEVFGCVFLDTRHRVISFEPLFRGTVDGATVYPREVLKRALHHNAAAVIAGHNHPSGNCEPSEADRVITVKLKKSLALVDIRLLDHLIVCRGGHLSLAERGWI